MALIIPKISEMSDKQIKINDLPIKSRYLISGGPGSGKTSIALRRTEYIKKFDPDSKIQTFLFTNALTNFFSYGIKSLDLKANVTTWARWQKKYLDYKNDWNYADTDPVPWKYLSKKILKKHKPKKIYNYLIIDEGQDFSRYDLKLMSKIAYNITIFADENQRLYQRGVQDIETIKKILNIKDENTYHLRENHRNTKKIIQAAQSLAPEEIDIEIDTIVREGKKPKFFITNDNKKEITMIKDIVKANIHKDIGILHLTRDDLKNIVIDIESNSNLKCESIGRGKFDWKKPGPKICTLNSAKGLEFDIVVMPRMNRSIYYKNYMNIKRIYVGMTRAKEDLIMLSGTKPTTYLNRIDENFIDRFTL